MQFESALVILVPGAEPLVRSFRERYDLSAAAGMPAHITINYPFLPGEEVSPGAIGDLRDVISSHRPFSFSLAHARRFPDALYLEPIPSDSFSSLIAAIPRAFPQSPPYDGQFEVITPHLTVAHSVEPDTLDTVTRQFAEACLGQLPIQATATAVRLMDNRDGRWVTREVFALGGAA